jgi:hypothetical protein
MIKKININDCESLNCIYITFGIDCREGERSSCGKFKDKKAGCDNHDYACCVLCEKECIVHKNDNILRDKEGFKTMVFKAKYKELIQ